MSHTALLETTGFDIDDDWIDTGVSEASPISANSPMLAAFASAQIAIARGEVASVQLDTDGRKQLDELDDAAIRAFFSEAE
ncbi:hypothetical protein ITJ38_10080 [Agreia pratensis]|uniref:hypothetical protein n=1 Tax=Agreia pratensis TaxID=150121 RepID=UPI00188C4070|nr:hypothetical protein [Agreia pratensis]MBF4634748.1 hypothetical protein [Agreia pratensis]